LIDRRTLVLASIAAVARARSASSQPAAGRNAATLVNSVATIQNPYYSEWDRGGRAFAKSVGEAYEILENQGRFDRCLEQIKEAIDKTQGNMVLNVDLASRFDAGALAELSRQAKVFLVTHSSAPPNVHPWDNNPYYVAHLASNHALAGARSGNALLSAMGGKGRIVALGGPAADVPARQRKAGLDQALARAQGYLLLDYQLADWESSIAFEITRWWLAKYRGQIDGVWAANDRMALGAVEALRVYKVIGKIPVACIDDSPAAISSIRSGELAATVAWDPFYQGGIGLAIAYSAKLNAINPAEEPDTHREFYLQVPVITRENVEQYGRDHTGSTRPINWKDLWGRVAGPIGP